MFRKAWLIKTGTVHIFPDMGSSGVYLTPGNITSAGADLNALTVVRNPLATPVEVVVRHFVTDPNNKACAEFETKQTIPTGETARIKAAEKSAIRNSGTSASPIFIRCALKSASEAG